MVVDDPALRPQLTAPDGTGLVYRSPDRGPGLHVLLVGISSYRFLAEGEEEQSQTYGLGQLDSAAQTVGALGRWLLSPDVDLAWPVRTIRLLASPSAMEAADMPALRDALPATFANFKRALKGWRLDANAGADGAALFYYSGHGIQRTRGGSTLLLSDFLDPEEPTLAHTTDFNAIYDGMAEPRYCEMASTQLYFVDACRTDFDGLQDLANANPPEIWDISEGGRDDRVAPVFYGASVGRQAFGAAVPGQVSAFGRDIMNCLSGSAADLVRSPGGAKWTVTIGTLADAIALLVAEANRTPGRNTRSFMIDRWTKLDTRLVTLRAPPEVSCRFTIDPPEVLEHVSITLATLQSASPFTFGPPWGQACTNRPPAGGYIINAALAPECATPYAPFGQQIVSLKPPIFDFGVTFTP
jgi:hypothetical protein